MTHRDHRGFSIIEVLVATSLAGVVMLSIAPLLMLGVSVSGSSREATYVLLVASEHMERLRSLPFGHVELAAGGDLNSSASGYSIDPIPGNTDEYVRWEVADVSVHLKQIRLMGGTRRDMIGPSSEVLLETFRTDLR